MACSGVNFSPRHISMSFSNSQVAIRRLLFWILDIIQTGQRAAGSGDRERHPPGLTWAGMNKKKRPP
jgi:hypothetical protein